MLDNIYAKIPEAKHLYNLNVVKTIWKVSLTFNLSMLAKVRT
jgi:hypothetical protein